MRSIIQGIIKQPFQSVLELFQVNTTREIINLK
jgi:hypothetical protein